MLLSLLFLFFSLVFLFSLPIAFPSLFSSRFSSSDLRSNNRDTIQTVSDFRDSVTRVCVFVADEAGGGRKDNMIMATRARPFGGRGRSKGHHALVSQPEGG